MSTKAKIGLGLLLLLTAGGAIFISRYAVKKQTIRAGFEVRFIGRPDGYPALRFGYGLNLKQPPVQMETDLLYKAIDAGDVELISAPLAGGAMEKEGLTLLKDDKQLLRSFRPVLLVRTPIMEGRSEIGDELGKLTAALNDKEVGRMVGLTGYMRDPEELVTEFLQNKGLLAENKSELRRDIPIKIGATSAMDKIIIGEAIALILEHNLGFNVIRRFYLPPGSLLEEADGERLDIFIQNSGEAIYLQLGRGEMPAPEKVFEKFSKEIAEPHGLTPISELNYSVGFGLALKKELAEKLGLSTISDLSEYLRE